MRKIVEAQRSEWRLATLLIGAIQVLWSVLPAIGGDWRLLRVLKHFQQDDEWLIVMAALGVLLIVGATCRWRAARQIGLTLSCGIWVSYFVLWVQYTMEIGRWVVSPVFITAPLFALFCFLLLINDVLQKPHAGNSEDSHDLA